MAVSVDNFIIPNENMVGDLTDRVVQTSLKNPIKSDLGPSVATLILIIAVVMVITISAKMPAKASLLRVSICTC